MTANEKGKPIEVDGLIAAKCPTCGGILSLRKGGEVRCDFCGNKFILHESYKGKSRAIHNYYELAYAAQECSDARSAYKYFTKVLELDSTEALAWYGKGVAALGYSKTRKIDTTEAITLFKRALSNVAGEERDRLRETVQESCFYYADSIFDYLRNRGLLNRDNFREILALFYFADEVFSLENNQMKRIVTILCTHSFLPFSERKDKVDYYTKRIRATEPAYLNPWEEWEARKRGARSRVAVHWGFFVVISLVVIGYILFVLFILLSLVICLACNPSPSLEGGGGVTERTEDAVATKWYLVTDVDWGVPLREQTEPNSGIIGRLEKGERVEVMSRDNSGDRREVKTGYGSGWAPIVLDGEEPATESERREARE